MPRSRPLILLSLLAAFAAGGVSTARADGKSSAFREAAEWALRKFTGRAAAEATEALAGKMAASAARYGDDLVTLAVKKGGPKALSLADEAAEISPKLGRSALGFVAKHGDGGAALLAKGSMKVLAYGDDAAELLIKHKGVAGPLIESLGEPAVMALAAVGPRNGRRLAMMAQGGELAAIGRADELMGVVARFGDKSCDFIYRNKVGLASAAAMAAFMADPEPFIEGARDLSETVVEKAVAPVATAVVDGGVQLAAKAVEPMAREAARSIPWAWLSVAGVLAVVFVGAVWASAKPKTA